MEWIVINESKLKIMLSAPDMRHYELSTERMDAADEDTRRAFRHIFDDARAEIGFDTTGERLFVQLYTSKEGGCEIFVTKLGEPSAVPYTPPRVYDDGLFPAGDGYLTDAERGIYSAEEAVPGCDEAASPGLMADSTLSDGERALLRRIMREEGASTMESTDCERVVGGTRVQTSTRLSAWVFPALAPLLAVCRRLREQDFTGVSRAYAEDTPEGTVWYLSLELPATLSRRLPHPFAFLCEYGWETDGDSLALYLSEHGQVVCPDGAVDILGVL